MAASTVRGQEARFGRRQPLPLLTRALVALELFLAFWAFAGSYGMLATPHGGVLDIGLLDGSPFGSFIIPGISLLVANGLLPLAVAFGTFRRAPWANLGHLAVGVVLLCWISAQVMFIGYEFWLQPAFFIYGLVVVALALMNAD